MKRQSVRSGLLFVSFFYLPVTFYYLSSVISTFAAYQGIVSGAVLLFAAQFVSALVLGRAWCGWLCPTGGLQEACFAARNRRVAGGRWNWTKYFIWAPWLANLVFAFVRRGVVRIEPGFMTTYGLSAASVPGMISYVVVMSLLLVLPALLIGRRAFCHYLCWMAPFMIVGQALGRLLHIPSLHLRANSQACSHCGTCTRVCPMSIDVQAQVARGAILDRECINCGRCADNCPKRVISFVLR